MIAIDTHVLIWSANTPEQLSNNAIQLLETSETIGVSIISCWETAMLVDKGRLSLNMEINQWMNLVLQPPEIELLPLTPEIAVLSTQLPGKFHKDPADRFIAATCLFKKIPLITKDEKSTQ